MGEYRVLDSHDTNRLLVEARQYLDGRVTVWWTDGPRQGEDDYTLEEALKVIEEHRETEST